MTNLHTPHDPLVEDDEHGDVEHHGEHEPEPGEPGDGEHEPEPGEPVDGEHEPEPGEPVDGEHEQPGDAPTEAVASQQEIERAMKALDKESERHAKRVAEIMGDDFADLERCPLCPSPFDGFRFPFPPAPEVVARVKEAIGEPAQPTFKEDSYSKVCELCDGLGAVGTGSRVAGQGTARCLGCDGRGWVAVGPERQGGAIAGPAAVAPAIAYEQPAPPAVEPPEVAALKALGYVVVPPIAPLPTTT